VQPAEWHSYVIDLVGLHGPARGEAAGLGEDVLLAAGW
jgi:hypothetical protein